MNRKVISIFFIIFALGSLSPSLHSETYAPSQILQDCYGNGDINGDGSVRSFADLYYFEDFLYRCGPPPPDSINADLNNDCIGNSADFSLLQCFIISGVSCFDSYPVPTCCRVRLIRYHAPGDLNKNGEINILDLTALISYLYKNGPVPEPLWIADINANGICNIIDVAYLTSYLYKDGPEPQCLPH